MPVTSTRARATALTAIVGILGLGIMPARAASTGEGHRFRATVVMAADSAYTAQDRTSGGCDWQLDADGGHRVRVFAKRLHITVSQEWLASRGGVLAIPLPRKAVDVTTQGTLQERPFGDHTGCLPGGGPRAALMPNFDCGHYLAPEPVLNLYKSGRKKVRVMLDANDPTQFCYSPTPFSTFLDIGARSRGAVNALAHHRRVVLRGSADRTETDNRHLSPLLDESHFQARAESAQTFKLRLTRR